MFSNVKIGPVWADWPTPPIVQNGPHCRAVNTWVSKFFHKTDLLLILIFVKHRWKFFRSVHSGPIGRPPIFQNGPQNGASNTWVGNFFHKTDPHLILILCEKKLKNFQIGPFWADQMGPQIHELAIFFIKQTPFEFGFCVGNCSNFLNWTILGRLADTPIYPKRPTISGPKYKSWHFFH